MLAAVHKKLDCILEALVALHFIAFGRVYGIFGSDLSQRRRDDFLGLGNLGRGARLPGRPWEEEFRRSTVAYSIREARFPAGGHALLCERCDAVKLAVISAKPSKLLWELQGTKT